MNERMLIVAKFPLVDLLRRGLERGGYVVETTSNPSAVPAAVRRAAPALVLVGLPETDEALALCRALAEGGAPLPVLLLTEDPDLDPGRGLDAGADMLLRTPTWPELLAGVRALLRRRGRRVLRFADVRLDRLARAAWRGERRLNLTPRELALLELFLERPGRVLTLDELQEGLWGGAPRGRSTLQTYVMRLRRELGPPPLLRTVRGVGYILQETEEEQG